MYDQLSLEMASPRVAPLPVAKPQALPDPDLGQWMTPVWAAQELVGTYFGDLTSADCVLEPSCGKGAFLSSIPSDVPAFGVEIDPKLAAQAMANTGRKVVIGDFRAVDIPFAPTAIIGNPPFRQEIARAFIDRAWELLPADGRVGLILPCYAFQTASAVVKLAERWGLRQDFLPRNVFPGLHLPLCFAMFTKGAGRAMVGFTLYHETDAINGLARRYRKLLATGERSVWAAVVRAALECMGGEADLPSLYREIQGNRPTACAFWKEKIRQTLQRIAVSSQRGLWRLPDPA
ncbi:MAG TPA: hypothetical protein VFQ88_15300 [Nevskiaceae bacterium]|nr:hypothetical protein [Nevskiaceae bacterium]